MWNSQLERLEDGRVQRFWLADEDGLLSYRRVLVLWRQDASFRDFFTQLLVSSPFPAFRWETPPVATDSVERDFEFVLVDSPGLERAVDARAFAEHFQKPQEADVATFANLSGDAVMVVPCPVSDESIYGHLASFVRHAPTEQVHHLWQAVGKAVEERLSNKLLWLSTAGMGVAWLHVRLDSRPKYYSFGPYKRMESPG